MRCFLHSFRAVLGACAVSALLGAPATVQAAPDPAYAFAQQKVYGMTITDGNGSKATITAKPFSVTMHTSATYDSIGTKAYNGGLDSLQAFVSPSGSLAPVQNYNGNLPAGFSTPTGERVLLQNSPTPWGTPQDLRLDIPTAGDFTIGNNFARADAYATPNPDNTVGPNSGGSPPTGAGWPADGIGVAPGKLVADVGTPGTLSIDSVAEVLFTDAAHGTIGSSVTDWTVTGGFAIANNTHGGGDTKVTFNFNLIERLVVFSNTPPDAGDGATASNTLSFDVLDSSKRSVFSSKPLYLPGQNPSSTRMISSVTNFSQTYNNATSGPTHLYPGPKSVEFQTDPLKAGDYTFIIKGTTTAKAVAVPEPGALVALASAVATLGVAARARRGRAAVASHDA